MNTPHLLAGFDDAALFHQRLRDEPEPDWIRRGQDMAFGLFHAMARRVPAYRDFLASCGFDPASVKSPSEFHTVPKIDKENYLRRYPTDMLSWDGAFPSGNWTISMTSGSTGDPYYFPRQSTQGAVYASMAELYLRANFRIHERRTLYVVAFPMGAWIGGVFTYEALTILSQRRQYDLSVITPGIDKRAVVNAVKRLSPYFDQVIIGAYAPFLKDILDDGVRHGVDWHGLRLGFVLSAEAFSEQFRDYLARTAALDNVLLDTLNHYGTVDMGTMAHETPLSILTRRTIFESPATVCRVFPEEHQQPTLAQYIPELFHFEEDDATLICSSWSGLPW